jgi:hypothetical protein
MEAEEGLIAMLVFIAIVAIFAYCAYDAGYKAGEVNILSGKAPTYHLVTNDVGEVNWSKQ